MAVAVKKARKSRYQTFLVLSCFTGFLYSVPSILPRITDKENKILIVFDDMIVDMIQNKKLNSLVTELFIRGRKLNISLVFITQSYFKVPKEVRLNTTHFLSQIF